MRVICEIIYNILISDPDSSNCDADCGALTESNIQLHILCRLECVRFDFSGMGVTLDVSECNRN